MCTNLPRSAGLILLNTALISNSNRFRGLLYHLHSTGSNVMPLMPLDQQGNQNRIMNVYGSENKMIFKQSPWCLVQRPSNLQIVRFVLANNQEQLVHQHTTTTFIQRRLTYFSNRYLNNVFTLGKKGRLAVRHWFSTSYKPVYWCLICVMHSFATLSSDSRASNVTIIENL